MAAEQVHRCPRTTKDHQGPPRTTKDHRGLQSNNAFKANWAARTYRGYVENIIIVIITTALIILVTIVICEIIIKAN